MLNIELKQDIQMETPLRRCQLLLINITPKFPAKVQFLLGLTFPLIDKLCPRKPFVGGRIGYDKQILFIWLLIKKVMGWDFRCVGDMAGVAHTTLVRANGKFSKAGVYQKFLIYLVKQAYRGDGLTHDSQVAIPLLKKARPWLKKVGYVPADKGYDDTDIIEYIAKSLKAKAGIPIREMPKDRKGKKKGNYLNWKLKVKGRTVKKSILNLRTEVERFFSYLKRVLKLGKDATRGIKRFVDNTYLACIFYMLKRVCAVGITQF